MSVLDFFGEEDTRITQLVYDISGSNANDQLGHSISLGLSGEIIAVGAPTSSQGGTERGLVRVYQKLTDLSGVSSWNQMGADLAGTSDNLQFGHSVDLNGDGTILAVGTKDPSNTLLVYNYDGSSWNQYGDTIYLDNNTAFETSISHITKGKLNYDGTKLVALNHNLGYTTTTTTETTTTTYTPSYVTAGCTHNWDFRVNESTSVTDNIGSNVATYYNITSDTTDGASFTTDQTDYISCDSGVTYGDPFSFEIYFKFTGTVSWSRVIDIDSKFSIARYSNGNTWFIASANSGWQDINSVDHTIVNGTWYHVIFTSELNGTTVTQRAYIDGTLVGTDTTTNNVKPNALTSPVYFGRKEVLASFGEFPGNIRYGRMYNGKTLSQSEVTELYNNKDDITPAGTTTTTTTTQTTEYIHNGSVESYEHNSTDWSQVGNTIQSTSANDISGGDVAINDTGNTITIGYPEGKSAIPSTYTYTVTAGSVFEFYGEEYTSDTANPALSFKRGSTYVLNINTTSFHPFWIQTSDNSGSYDSANVYSSGITNNGIYDGTITFVVPMDAPDTLYYRCSNHGNMGNSISITSALSKTGIAKVFQYNTTDISWNQVGTNIDGSGENDYFGSSIAMNTSGEFIAVGGPFAGDASAGHVKVYQNVNNTWNQAGNQIQGNADNDQFGSAIDMNSDGKVIVVGAKNADSGKGSATVYQYKNTVTGYNTSDLSWNRIGAGITGDSAGDFVGTSVGIIGEGTEFSVGAPGKQVDTNDNAGTVESYTFDYEKISDTEPRFTQILTPILGTAANDRMGEAVVTSLTGDIIAISAPNNSGGGVERGLVRVYQKGDSSWTQLGSDLTGTNDNDQFGYSLDINADGTILSVGTKDVSNNALYVYQYDGSTWNQYGNTIKVFKDSDISFNESSFIQGSKVKLNKEGNKLITSNKYNVTNQEVTQVTTTHTSPYVTHGCTANFDFRTNSDSGVTDDIGNVECDYIGGSSTTTDGMECDNGAGTSFSSTPTKYARIQNGLTYGGEGSYEFYLKFDAGVSWCTLFEITTVCLQHQHNNSWYMFMSTSGGSYISTSTNTKGDGQYHHYVITVSSDKQYKMYIDGVLEATTSFTTLDSATTTGSDGTNFIGCERLVRGGFDGYYKFWRYYHGKVLSQSEVTDLYNDRDDTSTATGRDGTTTEGINTITTTVTVNYEEELVQAYEYSSPSWNQIGNTIESSSLHDISGGDIAINHSGDLIAVGYPNANGSGEQSGFTKIFKYNANDASWNQVSDNINGSSSGDYSGTTVVFDMCSNYLGISSPFAGNNSEGSVNVYKITDNSWEHFGNIDGLTSNEQLGSIAMTPSAEIIAVGSKTAFDGAGVVRIYKDFTKLSGDISGSTYTYNPTVQTETGSSIFLSEDGQIISVGEPGYNVGTDDNTGRVRVFNVTLPQPPVPEEADWLYNYSTSNALKSIYMKGMLEMDNATLRTRNEDNNLIGSVDASFNGGNVYLGETVKIGTETVKTDIALDVSGNTNISGNLKIIGNLSATTQINVDHVDISGDLIVSGDNTNISLSSQDVNYNSELNITDAPLNVNKSKLSDNAGKVPITVENVLSDGNYSQIGENIWGPQDEGSWVASGDWEGTYTAPMSINDTGDIIVIGYDAYDGLNTGAGLVRIYQYMSITEDEYNSGNTNAYTSSSAFNGASGVPIIANNSVAWSADAKFWVQLGDDIESLDENSHTNTYDQLGMTVSINGVGDIIAIASPRDDVNGSDTGRVSVFKYSTPGTIGGTWDLMGNIMEFSFTSSTSSPKMGTHMQLDQSGKIIAISSYNAVDTVDIPSSMKIQDDSTDYTNVAVTAVFQYRTVTESEFNAGNTTSFDPNDGTPIIQANGGTWNADTEYWVQLGNYMYIPYNSSGDGTMSMSSDGSRVMISTRYYRPDDSADSDTNQGATEVFEYSTPGTINGTWNRLGARMFGVASYGYGYRMTADMSPDGNVVSLSHHDADGISYASSHYGVVRAMEYRLVTQTEWDNAKKAATDDITTTIGVPLIYPDGDTVLNTTKKYWIQMGADIFNWTTSGLGRYCRIGYTYGGYMISQISANGDYGRIYKYTTVSESEYNSRSTTFTDYTYTTPPSSVIFTNGESWASDKKFWVQVGDRISSPITASDRFFVWNFTRDGTKFIGGANSSQLNNIQGCPCVQVYGFDTETVLTGYNYQSIVTDVSMVSAAESFGEDISLNPALSVPGNILIVDSSNSEYNYGSYTIHTDKDYTNYFAVGKSASDVFNIVNNNNSGVYMSSSANSFTGTSDERLKKNVCDIEDKDLENLQQLRPVSYKWKKQTDDTEHYGFIAQEVEKYLPNLVDENTCPDGSTYKGVAVDDLIPYMIKYIQKLKKKIAEKEKEMET